jgi:hypothetical protein
MTKILLIIILNLTAFASSDRRKFDRETCTCKDIYMAGRVQVVDVGADIRVRNVDVGEELRVKKGSVQKPVSFLLTTVFCFAKLESRRLKSFAKQSY